jgi:hypothetical protein
MRVIIVGRDEGTFLYGAVRILHGQIFARDFYEAMGPGTFYWLAAFYKLFGATFLASRINLFITSLGTALALYYLSCQVCTRYRVLPSLILAGACFGGIWPGISHHIDSNFLGLLSVTCLVLWNINNRSSVLFLAGLFAGATTCIHQTKGVLLLLAFLVWLLIQRRKTKSSLAAAGIIIGGYCFVVALVLIYFWYHGALGSLAFANFVFPLKHNGAVNSVSYALNIYTDYWTPWVIASGGKGWMIAIASILIIPLLFIAVLPLLLLIISIRYKWKSVTPVVVLYWVCGWAIWLSELHRKDIDHLVFGSPVLVIVFIHALTANRGRIVNVLLQILAISAVFLAAFNCVTVLFAGANTTVTRVGNVAVIGRASILTYMNAHTSPGEEILVYPYCPTYYFLSATTNPTPYSLLLYNYNTPSQYREVIDILEYHRIKYVIWDTTFEEKTAEKFQRLQQIRPEDHLIEPYLDSHYRMVEDDHGIKIMERKDIGLAK